MGFGTKKLVITDGLLMSVDPGNEKSYAGETASYEHTSFVGETGSTGNYLSSSDERFDLRTSSIVDQPYSILYWMKNTESINDRGHFSLRYISPGGLFDDEEFSALEIYTSGADLHLKMKSALLSGSIGRYVSSGWATPYDGKWVLMCYTYTGVGSSSNIKIYVNGDEQTTVDDSSGIYLSMANTLAFSQMRFGNSGNSGIHASVRNLMIYKNRVLSAKEIKYISNLGPSLAYKEIPNYLKTSLLSFNPLTNSTSGIYEDLSSNISLSSVGSVTGGSGGISTANVIKSLCPDPITGVLSDSPTHVPNQSGAFYFDGTNDKINFSESLPKGNVSFTIDGWAKTDAGNDSSLMSCYSESGEIEWYIKWGLGSSPVMLRWVVSDDGSSTSSYLEIDVDSIAANPNRWFYYAVYHDSENELIGLSVNGAPWTTAAHTTGIHSSDSEIQFGNIYSNDYFQGWMGNQRYYNRVLSSSEIYQNYQAHKYRFR